MLNRTQIATLLKTAAPVLLVGIAYSYVLYLYPFSFNYELEINGQYPLFAYACMVLGGWQILNIYRGAQARPVPALMLLGILLCAVVLFSKYYSFSNEHFICIAAFVMLSITLVNNTPATIAAVWAAIAVGFGWELVLGLNTYFSGNGPVTGSLQNTGVYACYIMVQLPVVWFLLRGILLRKVPVAWPLAIFALFAGCTLFLVAAVQSRTAVAAMPVALGGLLLPYLKTLWYKPKGKIIPLAAGATIACIGITAIWYMFQIKQGSSQGRGLLMEVAWQQGAGYYWLGTGLGRFTWYYPQWQMDYFHAHPNASLNYYFSAGESYILMNEYVQLLYEIGFAGCVVFIALLVWFFTRRSATHGRLLLMLKTTVATLLACGFTSYPFHINVLLFTLFLCLASAYAISDKKERLQPAAKYLRALPVLGLLTVAPLICWSANLAIRERAWNRLSNDRLFTPPQQIQLYEQLLPYFKADGKFLAAYGEVLLQDETRAKDAVAALENGRRYFIAYRSVEVTARAYQKLADSSRALQHYRSLADYIPSRFSPRYYICHLYLSYRDTLHAKQIATAILDMPVKIPSPSVTSIQEEMKAVIAHP